MFSDKSEAGHVGKMTADLFAQIHIVDQMILELLAQVMKPDWPYLRLSNFKHMFENAVVLCSAVEYVYCMMGFF